MPIIHSAIKKLHQDVKRHTQNVVVKSNFKKAIREYRKKPTPEKIPAVYTVVDMAVKKGVIHKNKAARLKSRLTKLLKK